MSKKEDIKIIDKKVSKDYTSISFIPDYRRF